MIVIDAGYFYAGAIFDGDVVARVAPIIKYMRGWTKRKCIDYCLKKNWKIALVS